MKTASRGPGFEAEVARVDICRDAASDIRSLSADAVDEFASGGVAHVGAVVAVDGRAFVDHPDFLAGSVWIHVG